MTEFSARDEYFMNLAINIAERAVGKTFPNPPVGCVIVNNDRVISKAATGDKGSPHAEVGALEKVKGQDLSQAKIYVTLEPCCHHGKNPPCTDAIIKSGIKEVFVANIDPSKKVNGQGIETLRNAGIEVKTGLSFKRAKSLNLPFFMSVIKKKPYVVVKAAVTMDGKIALANGDSKWITGKKAREYAHMMRYRNDAIMVGVNTVVWDDPQLNCRIRGLEKYSPVKIVLDSTMKMPMSAKILKNKDTATVVFSTKKHEIPGIISIEANYDEDRRLDILEVLSNISEIGINRLLVEGGAHVISSMLMQGVVDEIQVLKSPKIFGDDGLSFVGAMGLEEVTNSVFYLEKTDKYGEDIGLVFKNKLTDEFASVIR